MSEYLAAASELARENKKTLWLKQQQRRLKANLTIRSDKELTKLEQIEKNKLPNAT